MNTVYVLMLSANLYIGLNYNTRYEIPMIAYSKYEFCEQAARYHKDEEKFTGISYSCMEIEIKR